jgi:hypothetical protein
MLTSTMGYLACVDFPSLADAEIADAHQSVGAWLKWETGITSAQAKTYKSWARRVDEHPVIIEAMLTGRHMSPSLAARCCGWTRKIPAGFRAEADGILRLLGARDLLPRKGGAPGDRAGAHESG